MQESEQKEQIAWQQLISFWLVCFTGGAWCLFLLGSYASGQSDLVLGTQFEYYPFVAGLALFVLVAHAVAMGPQQLGAGHGGPFEEIITTQRRHWLTWVGSAILLIPLAAAWQFGAKGFSFESIQRQGLDPGNTGNMRLQSELLSREALELQFPPDALGDRPMSMLELIGSAGDEGMRKLLNEERVVLKGQLAPWPKNRDGGENKLLFFQLMITCCATDRVPLTAELALEEIKKPWEGEVKGSWAMVRGKVGFVQDEQSGYWRPQVKVSTAKPVDAPPDPFLQRF